LKEAVQQGEDFDWRYIARDLGLYGIRVMEELGAVSDAEFQEKLGPFAGAGQGAKIRGEILREVASLKKDYALRSGRSAGAPDTRSREAALEDWLLSAKNAPVFGGELGPDEKERLARQLPKEFVASWALRDNVKAGFFYLVDLNSDGEKDILLGLGSDIYLLRGNRPFRLRGEWVGRGGMDKTDNAEVLSADGQKIIKNRWDMLQIGGRIFFLGPNDVGDIGSAPETP
jgi:hypothetical protein